MSVRYKDSVTAASLRILVLYCLTSLSLSLSLPPHLHTFLTLHLFLSISLLFSTPRSLTHELSMSLCIFPFFLPVHAFLSAFLSVSVSLSLCLGFPRMKWLGQSFGGYCVCVCVCVFLSLLIPSCYLKSEDIWKIEEVWGLIPHFKALAKLLFSLKLLTTCERHGVLRYPRKQRARAL